MKNNWKERFTEFYHRRDGLGIGVSDVQDCEETIGYIESLLAEQKKELMEEVRTYIGDLDYEDMQTKSINQWVDEFIKLKGITL